MRSFLFSVNPQPVRMEAGQYGGALVQPTRAYLKAIVDRVGKHEFSDSEIYDFLVADEEAQSRRQEVRLLDAIKDATRPHLITPHAYMTGLTAPNYAQH